MTYFPTQPFSFFGLSQTFFSGPTYDAVEHGKHWWEVHALTNGPNLACVAGVNGKGEGERERGRIMGFWELGTRERLLQRPPFFLLRPPIFR